MRQYSSGRAVVTCLLAAFLVICGSTHALWGHWILIALAWMSFLPMALSFGFIFGFVAKALGYEAIDDVNEPNPAKTCINSESMIHSEKVIGRYMDTDIYEYVEFMTDESDQPVRCFFEGTIDLEEEYQEPSTWFVILEPGIVYVQPEQALQECTKFS